MLFLQIYSIIIEETGRKAKGNRKHLICYIFKHEV